MPTLSETSKLTLRQMIASDHIDFVGADSTGGRYTGSFDQNQEEIEIELEYEKRLDKAKQKYREKYSHVERSKRPPFHPPDRSSFPTNREKICIRLMVCGLEQSDVERCTPPSKFGQKFPHARRYVEAVRAVKLDDFVARWTAQLSHRARVDRSGLPSSVIRSTIAAQDEKNARDMLPEQPKFGSGGKGKGKGKGRGKTVLPAKSGRGKSGYGKK